jgi:hypothetical protein
MKIPYYKYYYGKWVIAGYIIDEVKRIIKK